MECQTVLRNIYAKLSVHPILTLIIIGMVIRIPISVLFTHSYDVKYWATILENLESDNGLYDLPGYYYTPVWGYFIAVIGYLTVSIGNFGTLGTQSDTFVFGPGTDWGYYADLVADPYYSLVYKMFFTICDILIAWLLYKVVFEYTQDRRKSIVAFSMWWFCPLIIYTSCVHAMFDSLPILITVLSMYLLLKNNYLLAGVAFGVAALCKLFPAYFMFIFIGYIVSKDLGNRCKCVKDIGMAVIGALIVFAIVMIPNILDGNLSQAFGMVSNRVSEISGGGSSDAWDDLVSNGYFIVIVLQPLIFALEIVMAWKMSKVRENRDLKFFRLLMLSAACIFLWTPTPTYMMLIIPFVILHTQINDSDYRWAYYAMAIFATCYAVYMHNYSDLIQASEYFGLIPAESVVHGIEFMDSELFSGMTVQSLGNFVFGALETLSIYSVFLILIFQYRKKRKQKEAANAVDA